MDAAVAEPARVVLVPMNEAEYQAYLAESIPDYARDKVESGQWAEAASLELSRQGFEALLPQGLATPGNHLFTIRESASSAAVGMIWFAVQERGVDKIAYVYDVFIKSPFQRLGHATAAFAALEADARSRGLAGIALHVFGHNTAARALYDRLGYQATNINLFKRVALPG